MSTQGASAAELGRQTYLSLTTFRRDGTPVPTPVWVVSEGDQLLVTTMTATGKVKRVRRTPAVRLSPCDRRGKVAEGAPVVVGRAQVRTDAATLDRLEELLAGKYGLTFRAIRLLSVLGRLRRTPAQRCALLISLDPSVPATGPQGQPAS